MSGASEIAPSVFTRRVQPPEAIDAASAVVVGSRRAGIGREGSTEQERVLLGERRRQMDDLRWRCLWNYRQDGRRAAQAATAHLLGHAAFVAAIIAMS